MNPLQKILTEVYLDYVNNFLTIEKFAEHYGISIDLAKAIYTEFRNRREDSDVNYIFHNPPSKTMPDGNIYGNWIQNMIYQENTLTLQGEKITLKGECDVNLNGETYFSIWGKLENNNTPIYPPKFPKSTKITNIPEIRQLFYYIGLNGYIKFQEKVRKYLSK